MSPQQDEAVLPETVVTRTETVTLRRAVLADLPTTIALLVEDSMSTVAESTSPADREPYEAAFRAIDAAPAHLLVVAESPAGELVGVMQLTDLPGLLDRGRLRVQIEGVRVRSDRRGNGLGAAMITWAVEEARRHGAGVVQLTSNDARVDAHRFYRRLGFEQSHAGFKLHLA